MFVTTEQREEKRRPSKYNWIFRDPHLKDYDDLDLDPFKYMVTGEKIPRDPEWKIIVKLRHTYRQDGKVKGKSKYVGAISYWSFIDEWIEDLIHGYSAQDGGVRYEVPERIADSAFEKAIEAFGIAAPDYDALKQQLNEKIRPWREKAISQYRSSSEEYRYVHKHVEAWQECIRLRGDIFQDWLADKERKRKTQEEEARRQREADEERARENARFHNERIRQGPSLDLSEEEIQMFKKVWTAGYRKMSLELHPDKGGDTDQMSILNGIKDKLGSLIK